MGDVSVSESPSVNAKHEYYSIPAINGTNKTFVLFGSVAGYSLSTGEYYYLGSAFSKSDLFAHAETLEKLDYVFDSLDKNGFVARKGKVKVSFATLDDSLVWNFTIRFTRAN